MKLKTFDKEIDALKDKLVSEIKRFFIENPDIETIETEDMDESINVMGSNYVNSFNDRGVECDYEATYIYEDLYVDDLNGILALFNTYMDKNK